MFRPGLITTIAATALVVMATTARSAPQTKDAATEPAAAPVLPPGVDPGPAIARGLEYLQPEIGEEPAALAFAYFLHRRYGLAAFADTAEKYEAHLNRPPKKGSAPPGAVRLFHRLVHPGASFSPSDLDALTTEWDRLTVRALYCDQAPTPPDFGEQLTEAVETGGYHLTHAGMAIAWLRDNECPVPLDDTDLEALAEKLADVIESEPPGDIPFEAAGVLHYLGFSDRVPGEFVVALLDAQNEDGGWAFGPNRPGSHWHPTLLALWALFEHVSTPSAPFVPPAPATTDGSNGKGPGSESGSRKWDSMVASEERLLALTPSLHTLAHAVSNLELPGDRARGLFAATVSANDLSAFPTAAAPSGSTFRRSRATPTSQAIDLSREELDLWQALFRATDRLDHTAFRMVRGDFTNQARNRFRADVKFEGRAWLKSTGIGWVLGRLTVEWEHNPVSDTWRIVEFRTDSLDLVESPRLLFREVLEDSIVDPDVRESVRTSGHDEAVRKYLGSPDRKTSDFFPPAMDEHPGTSVVDLDRDGFDDIYLTAHWGKNLMLRNRGDGTFEEIGADVGLDVAGDTAAAIFADFDNDGDADAVLARTNERSLYLRNDDGHFVDASDSVDGELPGLASSVSVADIDGDGLLDVYFSTYAAHRLTSQFASGKDARLLEAFVSPDAASQIRSRMESDAAIYDLPGPPNVVLRNLGGGRFRVEPDSALAKLVNTYQATWADYDGDLDPDVYLANDFAPNHLFRNDGDGHFTDVTKESGTSDVGFGMGATWGDVDGDGHEDLYVSNMYSKAGSRITEKLSGIDPRFPKMARGNTLFRNPGDGKKFVDLSTQPDGRHAQKAGWSWGGQLADVDNDGGTDLYVLSGYYTAPREFELPVDT